MRTRAQPAGSTTPVIPVIPLAKFLQNSTCHNNHMVIYSPLQHCVNMTSTS